MSKIVYLLGRDGSVVVFGVGCVLSRRVEGVQPDIGWCVTAEQISISRHTAGNAAKSAIQAWLQSIIAAPEGALLRWDTERGCVMDELAPADDVFEERFLPVPDALVYDVAHMLNIPAYAPSTEMTGTEAIERAA